MDGDEPVVTVAWKVLSNAERMRADIRELVRDEVYVRAHLCADFQARSDELLGVDEEVLWFFSLTVCLEAAQQIGVSAGINREVLVRTCVDRFVDRSSYSDSAISTDTAESITTVALGNWDILRDNLERVGLGQGASGEPSDPGGEIIFIMILGFLRRIHTGFVAMVSDVELRELSSLVQRFGQVFIAYLAAQAGQW